MSSTRMGNFAREQQIANDGWRFFRFRLACVAVIGGTFQNGRQKDTAQALLAGQQGVDAVIEQDIRYALAR